jgi:parallel beta-helix repeat protein
MMGTKVRVLILLVCIFSAVLIPSEIQSKTIQEATVVSSTVRTERFPLRIYSNEELLEQAVENGWQGSGTQEDPIIIENYIIRNVSHAALITDTDLHFVFRNNIIEGIGKQWCAVVTSRVRNAVITNNTIRYGAVGVHAINTNDSVFSDNVMYENLWDGIYMELSSSNNIISGNTFHHNPEAGIYIWKDCQNNIITENEMHHSSYGVIVKLESTHNTIEENDFYNCYEAGIGLSSGYNLVRNNSICRVGGHGVLVNSEFNRIEENLIFNNTECGLELSYGSAHTTVRNNVFINNSEYGIFLRYTTNNTIEYNDFYDNGETHQVCDNGTDTSFHRNYWHQWIGQDIDLDGYIDTPLDIFGNSTCVDAEPMVAPCNPIPDWYTFIPITEPAVQQTLMVDWGVATTVAVAGTTVIVVLVVILKRR